MSGCVPCGSKETILARMVLSHMAHGSKTKAPFEPTLVVWFAYPRGMATDKTCRAARPTGLVRFLACTDKLPVVRLRETCRELVIRLA